MAAASMFKVLRRTRDRLRLVDRGRGQRFYPLPPPPPPPPPPPGWDEFGDDGSAGVREPRRPSPAPPILSARATPPPPAKLLDLVAS